MNKKRIFKNSLISFKKWKNQPWAVFASVRNIVRISVLSVSYFLLQQIELKAQRDTISLEEIQIESSRTPLVFSETARVIRVIPRGEIEQMPANGFSDILQHIPSIDTRSRGAYGVQTDFGMRGGSFEQTLILLNGMKLNDAQTGHHNSDLPVDIEDIERIEVLEGPGNRVFGINSYGGAINIITKAEYNSSLRISGYGAEFGTYGGHISTNFKLGKTANLLSVSKKHSDGYLPDVEVNNTDFDFFNVFYQNNYRYKSLDLSVILGFTNKQFGANNFYSPKYPWQFEAVGTRFAALKISFGRKIKLSSNFRYKEHDDRFELFRESIFNRTDSYFINGNDTAKFVPGNYQAWNYYAGHNYHFTRSAGAELKIASETKFGKSAIGFDFSYDKILSNVLGEPIDDTIFINNDHYGFYTKSKERMQVSAFVEHVKQIGNFAASAGLALNMGDAFKENVTGGIDLSYRMFKYYSLFGSINQAVRIPTFTDLYYSGPTNIGNPDLQPEKALSYEIGIKYLKKDMFVQLVGFVRQGTHTIDWVKLNAEDKWQAQNLTEITTTGAEISFQRTNSIDFIKKINISYAFLEQSKDGNNYISGYALDYLNHKAVVSITHIFFKKIGLSWQALYTDRAGTYSTFDNKSWAYSGEQEFKAYLMFNGKIFVNIKTFQFYIEMSNITDQNYFEYSNISMPGRWLKAGLSMDLKF